MLEILTAEEVGELLRITPSRVLLLARRRELPSLIVGGRVRFDAAELQGWIDSQRRPASRLLRERKGADD